MTADILAQKNRLLIELELLKKQGNRGRRQVIATASEAAALEVQLALVRVSSDPRGAAVNFASAASCLSDANRLVEAKRLLGRAEKLADNAFAGWIREALAQLNTTTIAGEAFSIDANISQNALLRRPQIAAYLAAKQHFARSKEHAIIQLPVGCGKTGTMALLPFAVDRGRVLAIAPNIEIARNLANNLDYTSQDSFLKRCRVLSNGRGPKSAVLSADANFHDADGADYVVTNIQQLVAQGAKKWLPKLSPDYFGLILIDEGHHNVAESWKKTIGHFAEARVVSFTATPLRTDGQRVEGERIYRFPIRQAIREGYVRDLASSRLEPTELAFTYQGSQRKHTLEEVMKLREEDWFSKGVALSQECNEHIVDASIQCMMRLRSGSPLRHQIIAAACTIDHARAIRSLYEARGHSAEVIHSNQTDEQQEDVRQRLKAGQLDVVVHVQMLAEGADYPLLGVAAIFRPFRHLVPYVQFVGRIMRVAIQNSPGHPDNRGFVVTHVGLNLDRWWQDLKTLDEGDQLFFEELLNADLDFVHPEQAAQPGVRRRFAHDMQVLREEVHHFVQERFLAEDEDAVVSDLVEALNVRGFNLAALGLTRDTLVQQLREEKEAERIALERQEVSPQRARIEARRRLKERVDSAAKELLVELGISIPGRQLPTALPRLGVVNNLAAAIVLLNKAINDSLGIAASERDLLSLEQAQKAHDDIDAVVDRVAASCRLVLKKGKN